jgi:hypothetical protein
MSKNKNINSKSLKKTLEDSNKALEHWYEESKKYEASHIISDRIKAEINRLNTLQNQIRIELQSRQINKQFWYLVMLSVLTIFLLFKKPIFSFNLTLNNTILLSWLWLVGAIAVPVLTWLITKKDREAQREHTIQQTKYTEIQAKLVESQLNEMKK